MINRSHRNAGSTMIELLIAIVVTGLVMTAIAINTMYSIQREAQNRYKETATALAQDTMDLLQAERAELGWTQFVAKYGDEIHCVDDANQLIYYSSIPATVDITTCNTYPMTFGGLGFNRLVKIAIVSTDQITAEAYVYWQAGQDASEFRLSQDFYRGTY